MSIFIKWRFYANLIGIVWNPCKTKKIVLKLVVACILDIIYSHFYYTSHGCTLGIFLVNKSWNRTRNHGNLACRSWNGLNSR